MSFDYAFEVSEPLPNLEAIAEEALNVAVRDIQNKLGVDSGDFASPFFDSAIRTRSRRS